MTIPLPQASVPVCLLDGTDKGTIMITRRSPDSGKFVWNGKIYYCRQSATHNGKYVIYKERAIPGADIPGGTPKD